MCLLNGLQQIFPHFVAWGSKKRVCIAIHKHTHKITYVHLGACSCVEYGALEFKRADLLFVKSSRFHHHTFFLFYFFWSHWEFFIPSSSINTVLFFLLTYALSCLISIFSRHFRSSRSIALSVSHPCRQAQLTRGTFQISNGTLHSHIPFASVDIRKHQGVRER